MMARAKGIYILIVNVYKLFSFSSSRCFLKEIETFSKCFYRVLETLVIVWESSKKLWKHSPSVRSPTIPLASFFYNSIETWYMFSVSQILLIKMAGTSQFVFNF